MKYIKSLFTGRLNRRNFASAIGANIIIFFTIMIVFQPPEGIPSIIIYIFFWFIGISLCLRRLHDYGTRQPIAIIFAIIFGSPIMSPFGLIIYMMGKSFEGSNKYGNPDTGKFLESVLKLNN